MRTGDLVVQLEYAEYLRSWKMSAGDFVRGVAGELEDENWRLGSTTLVREHLGSWKMRTGDLVVQLEYAEYLGSWKMRTGDLVVEL